MPERLLCLDTSVFVKYLTPDEHEERAQALVEEALLRDASLVAPAFLWTELGSVLRKKARQHLLTPEEARGLWEAFLELPIQELDGGALRARAWALADAYALPTLYDAAFLACAELAPQLLARSGSGEFWTADAALLDALAVAPLPYVRRF